jgi:pimeloyl-ACP methyl ester carboxylesterase
MGRMSTMTATGIERRYVTAGGRQVHYRVCGQGPAVVLLHDSPRSSRLHSGTMKMLASRFRVFALDTPGYGNSDPLTGPEPTIPDFAKALGETLAALGLERAPLYATHTGAKIALALAARGGRMPLLVLDGLSIPDAPAPESFISAYMRPFQPDESGAYLASEWVHVRDMLRWFPWFSHKAESRIAMDPPSAEWLEDYGIDLFSAGPHYSDAYAAAMRWSPWDDLLAVKVPTLVAARSDDVLYAYLDKVPTDRNPTLSVERLGSDRGEWLDWLAAALAVTASVAVPTASAAQDAHAPRGYVDLPQGQLHWRKGGAGSGRTVLILSAPSTLEALDWAYRIGPDRPTLVPELPGFGDSDPLPQPSADAVADCLAVLIERMDCGPVDVFAIDLAAPIGARLAARHPALVGTLAIHGAPPLDPAAAAAMCTATCPQINFDPHAGTHLHHAWHMLRDSQVQWPWYDASQSAVRKTGVLPDPLAMLAALTGILKQRLHYGDAVVAALGASDAASWVEVNVPTLFCHGDDPSQAEAAELAALVPQGRTLALPANGAHAASLLAAALGEPLAAVS